MLGERIVTKLEGNQGGAVTADEITPADFQFPAVYLRKWLKTGLLQTAGSACNSVPRAGAGVDEIEQLLSVLMGNGSGGVTHGRDVLVLRLRLFGEIQGTPQAGAF